MYPHHISNVRLRIVHTYALKVLKGMEWCGQSGYLTILVPLIEKIADDNNYSLRYEKIPGNKAI